MELVNGYLFNMKYSSEINRSMKYLGKKKNVIFLGQSVKYPGNLIYKTLSNVNKNKKLELPIFEETQMGMAIGLALNNFIPVCCYPRFDFFVLSFNQLINHLDKIKNISSNEFNPFVIVRVLVGSKKPMDAGPQHTQDHTLGLKKMLKQIKVVQLKNAHNIFKLYKNALHKKESTIFVEYSEKY